MTVQPKHPADFNTRGAPLLLDEARALARGLELCDDASLEAFVCAIRNMREPVKYSNQDGDRRSHFNGMCDDLRRLGRFPFFTAQERLDRLRSMHPVKVKA